MYTRILVPLDGSEAAEGALAHAAQMANIFDAELILLRATFIPDLPDLDLGEAQNILVKESEAYLCDVAVKLKGRGRDVRTVVRWSEAAEAIIDYAVAQEVSVVVMATHGQRGPERWPMGSVAEKVLRSMRVPVLLIHVSSAPDEMSRTGQSVT
jgi:nucleotide-binding universal stress UspA family protein